jgi:uncharacterized protein with GYD domain
MVRYVILLNFTDQGIRNVKQTIRVRAFKVLAEKHRRRSGPLLTQGRHDLSDDDRSDEQSGMACSLSGFGNVRTETHVRLPRRKWARSYRR